MPFGSISATREPPPYAARDERVREPVDRRVELAPRQAADAVLAVLDDRLACRDARPRET